jgi:hypothetical protein
MNAVKQLAELEFSRYRDLLPGWNRKGLRLILIYLMVPLVVSFYLFRQQESPQLLFTTAVLALLGLGLFAGLFMMITFWGSAQREWWLTFPLPRLALVYAIALSLWRLGWRIGLLLASVCALHYTIAVSMGWMEPLRLDYLIAIAIPLALFAAAALPLVITYGLLITVLYQGWARLAIIPYVILMQVPISLIGLLFAVNDPTSRWVSPSYIWLYTLGAIVIGWPVTYLLLRIIAGVGMKQLSDVRLRIKPGLAQAAPANNDAGISSSDADRHDRKLNQSFFTLYKFERTRFVYYGSLLPVRLTLYTILAGLAVGSYFAAGYAEAMMELPRVMLMLPVMMANIWTMNINGYEMQKKRIQWWLTFPYSRNLLVLTRIAAIWVSTFKYMLTLSAAFWFGAAIRLTAYPVDREQLYTYLSWFGYSALLYLAALTVTMGVLQLANVFMTSTVMSIMTVPLYFAVAFETQLINSYLYPDSFQLADQAPVWTTVWMAGALGIPVALLSVFIGSKYLHLLLKQESSPRWMKNNSHIS